MWEAGDFTAEEWTTIQTQLDTLKVFAQDSEKSGREWSLITLETLEFLASLPESVRERLAAQKYYNFSVESPAPRGPAGTKKTKIISADLDTFKAGQILGHAKSKPVLINFANEWDAGGGWLSGMWGAQEECLMRRSSLYLSLWPLRRPDDELWRRSPPNRGPSGTWIPDLDHKRPVAYRQLGFGEGGERVILPHLEERPGDDQTDLRGNEEAMKILKRVDVPRAYTNDKDGFPLSEAGVVYTPSLLVFRSPDTLSPDGKITGSKAYPPWTTSLLSVAALDLRPERGNQGAVYGYSVGSTSPSEPYLEVTREKMRSVLYAAVQGGHDSIVLGALGCGVFANSPEVIAMEWRKLLEPGGEFGNSFSVVVFAITFSTKNFRAFAEVFGELGPCIGDGSGKADHEAEFTAHLRA
ncbi:unnamed protein product [Durusdinium trenchii]|uniref:Microbial-type PARG catalytic domain-containing protein n=2 Tax=Durusdinium trenchii TaxID=1381693 RepID=A0ABP0NI08_9DINO